MEVEKLNLAWWKFWRYFKHWDWVALTVIIFLLIATFYLIDFQITDAHGKWQWKDFDWASAVLGLIPVIPLMVIWFIELKERWVDSLPTYLNINLKHGEQNVAQIEYIPIQNGIDIRQQALTVLKELVSGSYVANIEQFLRNDKVNRQVVKLQKGGIEGHDNSQPFELISIDLFMTKEPPKSDFNPNIEAFKDKSEIKIVEGYSWYWAPLTKEGGKLHLKSLDKQPPCLFFKTDAPDKKGQESKQEYSKEVSRGKEHEQSKE